MWDDILKTIDHNTTPKDAVAYWGGDPASIELISTGINLVYRFTKDRKPYYLRLTHSQLMPYSKLEAATAFQYHLQNAGVPVCHLTPSLNQQWIESIHQDKHIFLAHVCEGVPGNPIHFDHTDLSLYENWGMALGTFHLASTHYQANKYQYSKWEDDIDEFSGYLKNEDPRVCKELNLTIDYFNNHPKTPKTYGLIHGDHRKGNVLYENNIIHFIDFDLPRYCWFMDDITRPFFSAIMKNHANWENKLPLYISGYRSVFPLLDSELKTFSWFMRYKALNMYLWTKNNWHGEVGPGNTNTKEWLDLMLKMILNQEWVSRLDNIINKIILSTHEK